MNDLLPLLSLVMAQKHGDSQSDAATAALMSMVVRPPMLGFVVGMLLTTQNSSSPDGDRSDLFGRLLPGALSKTDARALEQLKGAVSEVQRAVDHLRELLNDASKPAKPGRTRRDRPARRRQI